MTDSCLRKCDKVQSDLEHTQHPDDEDFKSRKSALSTTDMTKNTIIQENIRKLQEESKDKYFCKYQRTDGEFEYKNKLTQKSKSWSERLVKLAEKLRTPGGEEQVKYKIRQYLKLFPGNFDDDDEEGQRFRQQLPNYIVDKLKSTLAERDMKSKPPAMVYLPTKKRNLRTVIKAWIKLLPITKNDFLGRHIERDDILESLLQRLEPFILYRPKSNTDFKNMLFSYITEIASSIPLENDMNKEIEYMRSIVNELVENILTLVVNNAIKKRKPAIKKTGSMQNVCEINSDINVSEKLKNFVIDEFESLLKDSNKQISKNIVHFIETEIIGIFSDALQFPGIENNSDMKCDICNVLQEHGEFPNFQAKYFCSELVKKFKYVFLNEVCKFKKRYRAAYSETCLVYNVPQINMKAINIISDNFDDTTAETYTKIVSLHIDRWLQSIRMYLPMVQHQLFRDTAVNELTDAIINRQKYLRHSSNQGTSYDEHGYLQYLVFKWIRKLVGEDNVEIVQNVPKLLENIEKVIFPELLNSERNPQSSLSYTIRETPKMSYDYDDSDELLNYLYQEILNWYTKLPWNMQNLNNTQEKIYMLRKLANDVTKCVKTNVSFSDMIDKEVDLWTKNILKSLPRGPIVEELKTRIKVLVFRKTQIQNDASLQTSTDMKDIGTKTNFTSKVTKFVKTPVNLMKDIVKVIEQWLDSLTLSVPRRDIPPESIYNLAADIIDQHIFLERNPILKGTEKDEVENLKYQIYKRLNEVVSENNMELVTHASDLLQRLQNVIPKKNRNFIVPNEEKNLSNDYLINENSRTFIFNSKGLPSPKQKYKNRDAKINRILSPKHEEYYKFSRTKSYISPGLDNSPDNSIKRNLLNSSRTTEGHGSSRSYQFGSLVCPNFECPHVTCNYETKLTGTGENYYAPNNSYFQQTSREETKLSCNTCPCYCNNPEFNTSPFHLNPSTQISKICQDIGIITDNCKLEAYKLSTGETKKQSDAPTTVIEELPIGMTLTQTYECFDDIFRKRCEEIPIDDSTFEQIAFGQKTKREINNIIWKTYFKLKADPSIEYDYKLFLAVLDDQLDVLLNYLPQTEQMIQFRLMWKTRIVNDVLKMLDYVHNVTTPPSYREKLVKKFNEHFSNLYNNNGNQHLFIAKIVDAYILFVRYKTGDPTKTNIYKQRLIQTVIEFIESLKSKKVNHKLLEPNEFYDEVLSVLNSVPVLDDKRLKDEANEILIDEEIEQWYDDLYDTTPSELDSILLQKTRVILTKKLFEIEKNYRTDPDKLSKEMVHEITEFLKRHRFTNVKNLHIKSNHLVNKLIKIFKNSNSTSDKAPKSVNSYVEETLSGLLINANMKSCAKDLRKNEYPSGTKSSTNAHLKIPPHQIFCVTSQNVNKSTSPYNVTNSCLDQRPTSAPPLLANCSTNMPNNVVISRFCMATPREFDMTGFPKCPVTCTHNGYAEFDRYNRGGVNQSIAPSGFANRPEYPAVGSIYDYGCYQPRHRYPYCYPSSPYPYMVPLTTPPF